MPMTTVKQGASLDGDDLIKVGASTDPNKRVWGEVVGKIRVSRARIADDHEAAAKAAKGKKSKAQQEVQVQAALDKVFTKYKGQFAQYVGHGKAVPKKLFTVMSKELRDTLQGELAEVYVDGAMDSQAALDAKVGIKVDWTSPNTNAMAWADKYTFELVKGLEDTTVKQVQANIERLQQDVQQFFEQPTTLADLAGNIGQYIPDWEDQLGRVWSSEERAKMIAATEVTRASVQGEYDSVQFLKDEYGIEMMAVWQTSSDETVCDICGPLHGKREGDGWDEPPPAHVNCRCAVSMELAGATKHGDHDQSSHGRGGDNEQDKKMLDKKIRSVIMKNTGKVTLNNVVDDVPSKIAKYPGMPHILMPDGSFRVLDHGHSHDEFKEYIEKKMGGNSYEQYVRLASGPGVMGIEYDSRHLSSAQRSQLSELKLGLHKKDVEVIEEDHATGVSGLRGLEEERYTNR